MRDFEIISHTADLQICAYGKNEIELFKNALIGMFQSIVPIANGCEKKNDRVLCEKLDQKHEIEISSTEFELLLIDFLSEALYLSDTYNEAYLDVEIIKLDSKYLKAVLKGIKIQGFEVVEIKAVTYHNLKIERVNSYLKATIVFDI